MSPVYLDHNATSPIRPQAAAAVAAALAIGGNPSSVHRAGRAARRLVERDRETIAASVGALPADLVFASGGTEANHLALLGTGRPRLLVSAIEHDSVLAASPDAERIPVDPSGVIDLPALDAMLAGDTRPALVSLMLANNETGILQPVAAVAEIAHRHGALLHCDAVQALGKVRVDRATLGADLLTLSGHKIGGPQGIGALVVAPGVALAPLQRGGGQERGRRAGTENVAGIAGFAAAVETACSELDGIRRIAALRDALEGSVLEQVPAALVVGRGAARLPNTSCLAMADVKAETQVIALDLAGIMVSAGAACSSGKVRPSHVLEAMGFPAAVAGSAIRVSLGWSSLEADIDRFVAAYAAFHARRSGARSAA